MAVGMLLFQQVWDAISCLDAKADQCDATLMVIPVGAFCSVQDIDLGTRELTISPPQSPSSAAGRPGPEPEVLTPRSAIVPKRINFAKHDDHTRRRSSEQKLEIDFLALQDTDWKRRVEAVEALGSWNLGRHPGEFNQEAANLIMPALRAAMRDEQWQVRVQAAESLSLLGPEATYHAAPVLWETCSDPEQPVREAALRTLRFHGQEAPPERLQQPRIRCRPWQEPPRLEAVQEDLREDCYTECTGLSMLQEDVSTTDDSNEGESSNQSAQVSSKR